MIKKVCVIITECRNPYKNLAFEEYLTLHTTEDTCNFFLWQNEDTIVYGKNQNIFAECDVPAFQRDGGKIVRRMSGGGAVYHDLGNLNFTFAVQRTNYDVKRQTDVILRAVQSLGINAEKSGRNDILIQGRKFSGNAYFKSGKFCCHHGTLLIDSNTLRMAEYLTPDVAKLKSKGVKSVKSRVINLKELMPDLTIEILENALCDAVAAVYDVKPQIIRLDGDNSAVGADGTGGADRILRDAGAGGIDGTAGADGIDGILRGAETAGILGATETDEFEFLVKKYSSWSWNFGHLSEFSDSFKDRFEWGSAEICFSVQDGLVTECRIYSDSLYQEDIEYAGRAMVGCAYDSEELCNALVGKIKQPKGSESGGKSENPGKYGSDEDFEIKERIFKDLQALIRTKAGRQETEHGRKI